MEDIEVDEDKFRIYTSGTSGPVLVLLHGGGYSGLTWAVFTVQYILPYTNFKLIEFNNCHYKICRKKYRPESNAEFVRLILEDMGIHSPPMMIICRWNKFSGMNFF